MQIEPDVKMQGTKTYSYVTFHDQKNLFMFVLKPYENIGSTRVPDAVYQVSRSLASWFRRRRFFKFFTIYGHGHVTWNI